MIYSTVLKRYKPVGDIRTRLKHRKRFVNPTKWGNSFYLKHWIANRACLFLKIWQGPRRGLCWQLHLISTRSWWSTLSEEQVVSAEVAGLLIRGPDGWLRGGGIFILLVTFQLSTIDMDIRALATKTTFTGQMFNVLIIFLNQNTNSFENYQ